MKSSKTKMKLKLTALTLAVGTLAQSALAQATIKVNLDQPGHEIPPTLWGIFFEDINLSADGGIYPELVRNRSFEDLNGLGFWKFTNLDSGNSSAQIDSRNPLNTFNTHYLRVNVNGAFALQNEGYWGMNIVKGDRYRLNLAARVAYGFNSPLTVKLLGVDGKELASGKISDWSGDWRYHSMELTAKDSDPKATLQVSSEGKGELSLDMVSLMPEKTFKNHGLRMDLAQALADLHPAFMRFPGGNWIEGDDIAHIYHWKDTIGDIDARTPLWNTWGYNTTQGLGYYEYLQLCEDLGAEPLFGISDGITLGEKVVPMSRMGQWTQDALDAIEYANGPTNSVWGGLRAQAGHPAPFNLKYIEIGNENGGPEYVKRWPLLANAIRAKYPEMQLIMTTDLRGRPYPKTPAPDIIDEHYYESPESFMRRATQYDNYDRKGPKIFVGEYAVTQKAGAGNLRAALGEAAFMTGIERNSDVVTLASYAPLFVNLNHRAWNPDLINFDTSRWYGIPSYYVQQIFSENRGDETLPITVDAADVVDPPATGCIGVGTWDTQAEFKDVKVTAPDGSVLFTSDFTKNANGWKLLGDGANWTVQNGALRQSVENENLRALAGDTSWTNYTLTLKARKLAGREGFLILFHIKNDLDRCWWNIGGWGNTQDAVELDDSMDRKPSHVETNHWYDIKVEVNNISIRCWLDGKLVHEILRPRQSTHSLYASAATDKASDEVIVKVVNAASYPISTRLLLNTKGNVSGSGKAITLTSDDPWDENTIDQPNKIVPKTQAITIQNNDLNWVFPGNSFTVLRFKK